MVCRVPEISLVPGKPWGGVGFRLQVQFEPGFFQSCFLFRGLRFLERNPRVYHGRKSLGLKAYGVGWLFGVVHGWIILSGEDKLRAHCTLL